MHRMILFTGLQTRNFMYKITKYSSYASIGLNAFYVFGWIYVFNKFKIHSVRVQVFESFFPFSGPLFFLNNVLLIILTIVSIVFFAKDDSSIKTILLIIQILFLALYIWQYL